MLGRRRQPGVRSRAHWQGPGSRAAHAHFHWLAAGLALFAAAFIGATAAGLSSNVLGIAFGVVALPVPAVIWLAYVRAGRELRRPLLLLALAGSLWLGGTLVVTALFLSVGRPQPGDTGVWDGLFIAARLLVIAAVVAALRAAICVRHAVLDTAVVVAAGVALFSPFAWRTLSEGADPGALLALARPVLSIATIVLIASAALGAWHGIPRSFAMLAIGDVCLTTGSLLHSYAALTRAASDRWATAAWAVAASIFLLAASVIALGLDRRTGFRPQRTIPGTPAAAHKVLAGYLGALTVAGTVATFGAAAGATPVTVTGVAAILAIGLLSTIRARGALDATERAYAQLDRVLLERERTCDGLEEANIELLRRNVELRAIEAALAGVIDWPDEPAPDEPGN